MTILKFRGVVNTFDLHLASGSMCSIGGTDFIRQIHEAPFGGAVTVVIADSTFDGDLSCWEGSRGYGEYTPGDAAELTVGPHNILEILDRYNGQGVTMWVADEPINTLDGST